MSLFMVSLAVPPDLPLSLHPPQSENQPEPANDGSQREPEQISMVVQLPATSDVPPLLVVSIMLRILLPQWMNLLPNRMLLRFLTLRVSSPAASL